jgi:hypothetical protein
VEDLETRWKTILALEASMDGLRLGMQSLMTEMEGSFKRQLSPEEKLHAPRADISLWTKAKNRVHNALPKMKEYIHRSIWAVGAPERKRLEGLYTDHIEPHIPFPGMAEVLKELEALQKARQVLFGQGNTVYQECKSIAAEVQGSLKTLQSNAAANAKKKRAANSGGKFFKDVRRMSE